MEPNAGNRLKFIEENITKIKPLAYNIFGGILLVSDYDFLKHIFSQRSGSHRLSIHKIKLDEELREQDQRSTHRLVREQTGPNRSEIFKICWFWSGSVPDFEIFLGSDPVRSQISKFFLVLVRDF